MADYEDDLPYIVIERKTGAVVPFLWGALLGAGFALLYAPRSGRETRRELTDGARRLQGGVGGSVRQMQETVTGALDDVRREIDDRVDAARDAIETGRQAARETRADLERRLRESAAAAERPAEGARVQARIEMDEEGVD